MSLADVDEYLSGLAILADLVVDPPDALRKRVCRDMDDDYWWRWPVRPRSIS